MEIPYFVVWVAALWMDARAQTLNELPPSTGGDPVGIWEADQTPLQVYVPPELLAAISTFSLNGTLSGQLTMDAGGGYVRDYIVTTKATATLFIGPLVVDRADTQRTEGTYRVEDTNLILETQIDSVVRDTMGFTVQVDTLCLFTNPGEEASIITRLIPGAGPPIPILKFIRVGMPDTDASGDTDTSGVVLLGDFDGSGRVDFTDFVAFAIIHDKT